MLSQKNIFRLVIGFVSIVSFIFLGFFSYSTNIYVDAVNTTQLLSEPKIIREIKQENKKIVQADKPEKITAKGVYLTAYSAGTPKKMNEIISLLDSTELNTVVIDIKDYSGLVLYDTQVSLAKELGLKDDRLGDVSALIKKLHEHQIYTIARQTVFQDPVLAEKKPEWAIKNKAGGLWRDYKGLAWVDPAKKEIWDYNVAIAEEAISLGFDEINFDYVRFPSDGNISQMVLSSGEKKKYEVMGEFFKYLSEKLSPLPAWFSLDMFGLVMEKVGKDDMNIGQRMEDALSEADYICPMMYPSHYPSGYLGFSNPAAYPAAVLKNGLSKGTPAFENKRAGLRPWLQAFNMGAVYDAVKIRAEIDEVEKYTDAGWLLWNASNRYSTAGLKMEKN